MTCCVYDVRFAKGVIVGLSIGLLLFMFTQYVVLNSTRFYPSEDSGLFVSYHKARQSFDQSVNKVVSAFHSSHALNQVSNTGGPNSGNGSHDLNDLVINRTHTGETDLAQAMFRKIRILCWIMTYPRHHDTNAQAVKQTWGKRCNVLYFVSSAPVDNETLTVLYTGNESRGILWGKTKLGFRHAYEHYFDDADWFVKADDDTYMIMENLRYMLLDKDPATPLYYGSRLKTGEGVPFMSGGAGYILSKAALRAFVEDSLSDPRKCPQDDGGMEDVQMADCLRRVGISCEDSRDEKQKSRFFPDSPLSHIPPGKKSNSFWYWSYVFYDHGMGVECCSDSTISFHYIHEKLMWVMEYLIYHLHPFGIYPQLTGAATKNDIIQYLNQRNSTVIKKSNPAEVTPKFVNFT